MTSQLHTETRVNVRRNLLLTGELLGVVDLLTERGIRVIPYKGPVLTTVVYGDVALRQFGDLDVIVRSSDVAAASDLLAARGYHVALDITGKDLSFFHEKLGITLEMHWSITADWHPVQIPPERLWQDLQQTSLGGRSVLVHRPEDLLWMLCVHGAHHRWERLSWLCDVAEMVRSTPIDWDRAVDNAIDVGAGRPLFLGLLLARDVLGAEIPGSAVNAIESDRALYALAKQVKVWLAAPTADAQRLGEAEQYYVALGERLGDRLRIAFKQVSLYLAPTARDEEQLGLPRYLSWVVYVVRPIRLTWSYGFSPLTRVLRGLFKS